MPFLYRGGADKGLLVTVGGREILMLSVSRYFLSMGGNVTKKFITMLNKNENIGV